jgi:hypothetical protein
LVENFVQQQGWMGWTVFPMDLHARRCPLFRPMLTPEQQAEAQRIANILMEAAREEVVAISELLASKPDHELLGKAEFEVRDRVHKIGAKAVETALNERKKGGTKGPA